MHYMTLAGHVAGVKRSSASDCVCVRVSPHDRTKTITKPRDSPSWLSLGHTFNIKIRRSKVKVTGLQSAHISVEGDRVADVSLHSIESSLVL